MTRGWLGVSIQEVTDEIAKSFKLKDAKGALVAEVMDDTPAQKGGMERGDIIISYDGKDIETPNELQRIVASTPPNKNVKVKVIRNGKTETLTIKVGTMPGETPETKEAVTTDLGLTVQTLTPDLAEQFNWSRDEKGVLITGVDPGGAADEAGLRRGDLIKEIDRQEITTTEDYEKILGKTKKGESVLLLIKRGTRTFYTTLTVEEGE